ncbi:MAG: polysaccharide biosynthesis protein, partial [Burkholderiaceae bacterium]
MTPVQVARWLSELSPRTKVWVMIGGDALFLPMCMIASVAFRLGSLEAALDTSLSAQLTLALLTLPVLGLAGLYRAVLRYIDLRVLVAASSALAAVVLLVFALALMFQIQTLPRSALLIFWFVAFAYVVSSRFVARALLRRGLRQSAQLRLATAIYGAGNAGVQLAQAMQYSAEYEAACFLDDRKELQGKTVAGLKVYSPDGLPEAVFRHEIAQIVVAIPSASTAQKRRLIQRVEGCGLPVKILPSLFQMVDGRASVSDIREVDVADLLGRDAVPPDPALFARNIAGKVVMVTGAGGSIGAELCRQIASQLPSKLVLLDHSEFALYSVDLELRSLAPGIEIITCLGSVLDETNLHTLIAKHGVRTIYHAAAYKHVPIVEANMRQGVHNNVFGTLNIAMA